MASTYPLLRVAAFAAWTLLVLAIWLPLAAAGLLLNWLPYRLCARLARRTNERDVISTYKLFGGLIVSPVTWALEAAAIGWLSRLVAGLAAAILLPVTAWVALRALETWEAFLAEARAFFTMRTRTDLAARLLRRRDALHREIAALAATAKT